MNTNNRSRNRHSRLSKYFIIPQRYIALIFGCLCNMLLCMTRECFLRTLPKIISLPAVTKFVQNPYESVCSFRDLPVEETHQTIYEWTQDEKTRVESIFYVGYCLTHIPGGLLADNFGYKWVLLTAAAWSIILTIFSPFLIYNYGGKGIYFGRMLLGFCEGLSFPAYGVLIMRWIPATQRAMAVTLVLSSRDIGVFLTVLLTSTRYHWSFNFYIIGAMGFLWCLLFGLLCYNDPASHPFLKVKEREYLANAIEAIDRKKSPPFSPEKLLTNVPFYALIIADNGYMWGIGALMNELPQYFEAVLGLRIENYSIFYISYVIRAIVSIIFGIISDILIRDNYLSKTSTRKMMGLIACIGSTIFFLLSVYVGCNANAIILCFIIAVCMKCISYGNIPVVGFEICPLYTGLISGLVNGSSSIMYFIIPYSMHTMVPTGDVIAWRIAFWVAATVVVGTIMVFCIYGTAKTQNFTMSNSPTDSRDTSSYLSDE